MSEIKRRTCELLETALRSTRQYNDLLYLDYIKDDNYEVVIPVFENGNGNPINVHMDSCWAMIRDIVNHIGG